MTIPMKDKDLPTWDLVPEPIRKVLGPLRLSLWLVGGGAIACTGGKPAVAPRDWDFLIDRNASSESVLAALMLGEPRIKWGTTIFGGFKTEIGGLHVDVFRYDNVAHYLSTVPLPRHGIAVNLGTGLVLTTAEYQQWYEIHADPALVARPDDVITTRPVRNPKINSANPGDPFQNEPDFRF